MNLYFYVFIGVNVVSLLLCLYMVIKALRLYGLDDYPFSMSVLVFYINKFERWINRNWGELGEVVFKVSVIILFGLVRFSVGGVRKLPELSHFALSIIWFVCLFFGYCFISDFCILVIKTGRFVKDFLVYKKTKYVYDKYFYKLVSEGKWKKCFFTNEFKNVNLFKCGIILVAFSIILIVVSYGFNLVVKKFDNVIFERIYLISLAAVLVFYMIYAVIKLVSFFRKKFFKRDSFFKVVSFYPSGNVKEIRLYKNRYLYMEKVFFDKKNRLYSYIIFECDIHKQYFYSGNIAFEFFKLNNSIVYYRDNPRKEIVAESFFDEYDNLIYFVEYDFIKIFNGKNVKNEIVYKDGRYLGWKYLKLKEDAYIKQDISKEEIDNILQSFSLIKSK